MLRHIVMFKFKDTASPSDRDGLKTMLEGLPSQIDVIREFEVGYDVVRVARSYDMANWSLR